MGRLTRNYIYNLLYQTFVIIVPLITAPYLARTLGPEGTGVYGYVNSMATLICTFVLLGIYNYGNRQIAYVRDSPDVLSKVFWRIMSARIIIVIYGSIIYFSIVLFIGRYIYFFFIYYLYMLAYFIDPTWLFVGVEDMKWALLKNVLTKLIAIAGIFLFVKQRDDVSKYLLIQGSSFFISNLWSFSQIKRYVSHPQIDFSNLWKDLKASLLLFLPSVGTVVYTQCDKIMIELMTEASNEVAFYDYSEKIVTIPLAFITALSTVVMPRLANEFQKKHMTEIQNVLNKSAQISTFLAFPLTFGLIAISDKLIPWYLGDDFLPTIIAIKIISPIIIFNSLAGISGSQYFTATNQIKYLIWSQTISAAGNIILNFILIPHWGFYGAAIATVITYLSCTIVQYYFLIKQIKIKGLVSSSCRYLLTSLVMAFLIKISTYNLSPSFLTTCVQIIIGCLIYFLLNYFAKDKTLNYILNVLIKVKNKALSISNDRQK